MSICFSIAISDILLNTNMALWVPLSGIKPYCSDAISCNVLPRILFITTRRFNFVMQRIRLIEWCFSHLAVLLIFGQVYEYRSIQFLWEIAMVVNHICKSSRLLPRVLSLHQQLAFLLNTVRTRGFMQD